MSLQPSEMEAFKERMRSTWMAGDFGKIAQHSSRGAEEFVTRLHITPGLRTLDVACGTGNISIPAARQGAVVVGVDIAPNLLEQARASAASEGLKIQFDEGDAEQLAYQDGSFDLVVSMFGAMFAPRPERAAAELIRVCRSGGRIAMANWTLEGFSGQIFQITARYTPPPTEVPPPILWGNEEIVRKRLQDGVSDLQLTRRMISLEYPFDEAGVVEFFRIHFGPTKRAFDALDEAAQAALRRDLEQLWKKHNRATDGSTAVESEYLEVIALRS